MCPEYVQNYELDSKVNTKLYNVDNLSTIFRDLPKDGVTGEWNFSKSDSGFNNREIMEDFVDDLDKFCIENKIPKPVILKADGFKGHFGMKIIEELDKRDILLWLLRAHMSHIIQPLDVMFFKAVKSELNQLTHQWQGKHPGETLNRYTFVTEGLYPAMETVCRNKEMIAKSFAVTGLCPWNPNAVAKYKLKPGEIFDKTSMEKVMQTGEENDQPAQDNGEIREGENGQILYEIVVGPPVNQEAIASDDDEVEDEENLETNPDADDIDTEENEFWTENFRKTRVLISYIANEFEKEHKIDIKNIPTAMERVRMFAEMAKADLETEPDTTILFSFEDVITGTYLSSRIVLTKAMYERIVMKPGKKKPEVRQRQHCEPDTDQPPQLDDGPQLEVQMTNPSSHDGLDSVGDQPPQLDDVPQVEVQTTDLSSHDGLDSVGDQSPDDIQQQTDEEDEVEDKPIDR